MTLQFKRHFNLLRTLVIGSPLLFLYACSGVPSPNANLIASSATSAAGGIGGYLIGDAIDSDSEAVKLGGAAIGLIAAQQLYDMTKEGDTRKITEAYEQGKREARTEASNAYWRSVTGADGSEYAAAQYEGKKLHFRQIQYDPHVNQGVIYGGSYAPEDMTIRGQ